MPNDTIDEDKLSALIAKLKLRLVDYLVMKEVITKEHDVREKFLCINPSHEDKNPSCVLIPAERTQTEKPILARCWSCGASGDVLKACAWLEGKPMSGPDWVRDTVYYLADLLGEAHDKEIIPVDPEKVKILQLYSDAADCLIGLCRTSKKCDGYQHTEKRGLGSDICFEYGVGTVDWEEFFETLQKYGPWDAQYILDNNITSSHFGTEFITITLRDQRGQVIGFDRRFVHFDHDEFTKASREKRYYPTKFMNSANSSNENLRKIWQAQPFFYGFDKCAKNNWRRLDVVEGYFDVIAAAQAGHNCIVASCGTSTLKDEHFDMLHRIGFSEVSIVMDNDGPGQKASETCLEKFGKRGDIRLSFVRLKFNEADEIPAKDQDPDTFFRRYGMKEYLTLPVVSAFAFLMHLEKNRGARSEALVRKVIPQLAAEADGITRGNHIRDLCTETGVHEDDVREEVDKIRSGQARVILEDMRKSIDRIGEHDPSKIKSIMKDSLEKLSTLSKDRVDLLSGKAATANLHRALDGFDNDRQVLAGWRTGIPMFDERMLGFRKQNYMVIGGNPNTGKSSFSHFLIAGLLRHEANDQAIVMYSLDDPVDMSIAKQISCYTKMPIEWCARPQVYMYPFPERARMYMEARDFYRSLIPHRLRIFGGEAGSNIDTIISGVHRTEDETGNHVILVVDSFHLMHGAANDEERAKFERNSEKLHMLMHGGATVIVTAEARKEAQGRRPRMGDLSETRGLSFDSTMVGMIYNELHEKLGKAKDFWVSRGPVTKQLIQEEVVELTIEKNKNHGAWKGSACYKTFRKHAHLEEIKNPRLFFEDQRMIWAGAGFEVPGDDDVVIDSNGKIDSGIMVDFETGEIRP